MTADRAVQKLLKVTSRQIATGDNGHRVGELSMAEIQHQQRSSEIESAARTRDESEWAEFARRESVARGRGPDWQIR